ncbi:MAG: hypothetical protein OEL87_02135 [Nanoarchaeota archaeon]|nr:hypothetical protein [Nanoarchaeota archaeon]
MKKELQKKGQVTIFILIAIVIVSAVLVFFLWTKPTYFSEEGRELNFEGCVKDVVNQAIGELEKKAGSINPQFTYQYNGEQFTYLCYTNQYYETCTVQTPFLKNIFNEQMNLLVKDKIDACYSNSISDLKSQGYSVTEGNLEYDTAIEPGIVRIEIEAPTTIGSQSLARFNVEINSPIYEMVMISTSILQSEAKYGDSDTSSIMRFYPNYIINKIKRSDGTTIYILENQITKNKFQFASRSLAWPAGYVLQ